MPPNQEINQGRAEARPLLTALMPAIGTKKRHMDQIEKVGNQG